MPAITENASGPLSTAPKRKGCATGHSRETADSNGPRGDKALYDPYVGIMVITPGGYKRSVG